MSRQWLDRRRGQHPPAFGSSPTDRFRPDSCPDRPDPADDTPRMRYADADTDPRVTLLGGLLPMRSDPTIPPGLAIVRPEQPGDLDVGGALDGVDWRDTWDSDRLSSVHEMLVEARRAMETEPYHYYGPTVVTPGAYADGVARGLLPPLSHAETEPGPTSNSIVEILRDARRQLVDDDYRPDCHVEITLPEDP